MIILAKDKKGLLLRQTILDQIRDGTLETSGQIATEKELASIFKMGIRQVRGVLSQLTEEGILLRVQGRGTFVTEKAAALLGRQVQLERPLLIAGNGPYFNAALSLSRGEEDGFFSSMDTMFFLCDDSRSQSNERMIRALGTHNLVKGVIYLGSDDEGRRLSFLKTLKDYPAVIVAGQADAPAEKARAGKRGRRKEEPAVPVIHIDEYRGMFEAVLLGFNNNHRRLAYVRRTSASGLEGERMKGFRAAHVWAGVPADEELTGCAERPEALEGLLERMLRLSEPATFFIFSDVHLAQRGIQIFSEKGLSVPEEISVAAFEACREGACTSPPITGISISIRDVLETAADLIDKTALSGKMRGGRTLFTPEIIARKTLKARNI